jgi:hypothetical protein
MTLTEWHHVVAVNLDVFLGTKDGIRVMQGDEDCTLFGSDAI